MLPASMGAHINQTSSVLLRVQYLSLLSPNGPDLVGRAPPES